MALIKCPECTHEISDKAIQCPYCGYPLAKILASKRIHIDIDCNHEHAGETVWIFDSNESLLWKGEASQPAEFYIDELGKHTYIKIKYSSGLTVEGDIHIYHHYRVYRRTKYYGGGYSLGSVNLPSCETC